MRRLFDPSPYAPIPGTERPRRALFLDRWGTLLELPERGHGAGPDDVRFLPGVTDALFRAAESGWTLYLVGNENAVAQGQVPDEAWEALQERFHGELEAQGVPIQRDFTCVDHPQGKGHHERDSVFLLPNTGAFYQAAHHDGINIQQSWVIGDSTLELVAGWRAGSQLAGVRSGLALGDGTFEVEAQLVADDLPAAVNRILSLETTLRTT
jgi:D-glycero-D-manno-heptose 1,7-bisphosphate phosphatase